MARLVVGGRVCLCFAATVDRFGTNSGPRVVFGTKSGPRVVFGTKSGTTVVVRGPGVVFGTKSGSGVVRFAALCSRLGGLVQLNLPTTGTTA